MTCLVSELRTKSIAVRPTRCCNAGSGGGAPSDNAGKGGSKGLSSTGAPGTKGGSSKGGNGTGTTMALSVMANRSSAVGLLSTTAARAQAICDAGAYIHW
jgi:hypothetical protein